MEMTLQFTTKERYKKAVHHMMHDSTGYTLKGYGKYLYGPVYGYITIEKSRCIIHCETCGKPFDLNAENPEIMPCEVCLDAFCPDCFSAAHGRETLNRMLNHGEYWACPKCFPKYKYEIFPNG